MKKLALALCLVAVCQFVRADELVQNSDFSDGIAHWEGDCHTLADMVSQESEYQAPAGATNAAVVKLRDGDWTKVSQDFDASPGELHIAITYVLSPGLTFSQRPDDYANTTANIGYTAWLMMKTTIGSWVFMLSDMDANRGQMFEAPVKEEGTPETFHARFLVQSDAQSHEQKSICLGFPPGKGFVTLEKISVTTASPDGGGQ